MHEMCLLEYRFVILNGAFLVHTPGIKRRNSKILKSRNLHLKSNFSSRNSITTKDDSDAAWRNGHMKRNSYLYQIITQDVMGRYRYNPRCRIH